MLIKSNIRFSFYYINICTSLSHTALHFEVKSQTKFDTVFFVYVILTKSGIWITMMQPEHR